MCSLESVWDDAFSQHDAFHMVYAYKNTECLVYKGFKIESDDKHKIHIYKPKGEVYEELKSYEYTIVCEYGWRKGVLKLVLNSYQHKLSIISDKIRDEVNTRRNDKHLKSLKSSRQRIMDSYLKVVKQISKL